MGTLDTILNVASLATEIHIASQVAEMRRDGTARAELQMYLKQLRDEIFQYNETKKDLLELEAENPKAAAGGMRFLETRLENSGITPDLFIEIADMQFAADVKRSIRSEAQRLSALLTPTERDEIERVVQVAWQLPDYEYYLENSDRIDEYRAALKKTRYMPRGLTDTAAGIFKMGFGAAAVILSIAMIAIGASEGCLIGLVLLAILGGVAYLNLYALKQHQDAHSLISSTEAEVDINRYESLEKQYGRNREAVRRKYDEARRALNSLFGDAGLLAD